MERRNFLKSLLGVFGVSAAVSFIYPLIRFLTPEAQSARKAQVKISRKKLPPGAAVKAMLNDKPIIVIHHPNKGYIALSRVCTHLGCLVDYDRAVDRLICPCHGANFTVDGTVISGPAPSPLREYPLVVKGKDIIVG
ncbi:MAG: Rieske (2Fe-2S) protein [Nitrospirae bacterium]|nr:MAG: Rieske (2Fe-2S) protein [Nitrospirota bacterium]